MGIPIEISFGIPIRKLQKSGTLPGIWSAFLDNMIDETHNNLLSNLLFQWELPFKIRIPIRIPIGIKKMANSAEWARWYLINSTVYLALMSFDGPKNLMSFDGPKSRFSPFKISCLLMDPFGPSKDMRFIHIYFQSFQVKIV